MEEAAWSESMAHSQLTNIDEKNFVGISISYYCVELCTSIQRFPVPSVGYAKREKHTNPCETDNDYAGKTGPTGLDTGPLKAEWPPIWSISGERPWWWCWKCTVHTGRQQSASQRQAVPAASAAHMVYSPSWVPHYYLVGLW